VYHEVEVNTVPLFLPFAFALNFALLFGWMDWVSAFVITVIDWLSGILVYFWISETANPVESQFFTEHQHPCLAT